MTKILVIDDDKNIRNLLNRKLSKVGYEVVEAADGEEGLRIYRNERIDLVITDVFMPEKEGVETVLDLKKINPDSKIIAISGGSMQIKHDFLSMIEDLGAQKTFKKPFDTEELLAAVKELLAGS